MGFYEVLHQVIDLLQRRQRVAYRALKRQFDFDDDDIEALKDELIDAQRVAVDEEGKILVWTGGAEATSSSVSPQASGAVPEPTSTRALESASVSYGKATPYFPIIDLLKHYVHLDDQDDVRTMRAKVTGHVLTLDETLHETIPPLLALLEALPDDNSFLRLDPSLRRQRTLNALQDVLLRESQEQPLLLVFEDLHWVDAETLGDRDLQDVAQRYLGRSYYALGDYPRAIDILRPSVAALSELSRIFLTYCLAEVGAFAEGLTHGETILSRASTGDRPFDLSAGYTAVGRLYLRKGDLSQAIAALERGMELCQAANLPLLLPHLAAPLGAAYTLHGQLADAIRLLEQAIERAEAMGRLIEHSLSVAWLGEAHLRAGRVTLADDLARRALADAQRRKEHGCEAWILHLLGTIHAQQEVTQMAPAAGYYQQALALAEARAMRPLQAHCYLGLGALYAQQGRGPQAQSALTRALALYRSMEMTLWLPQVEAVLAHV